MEKIGERESLNSTNNKQMKLTLCEQDKHSKQNISKVRVSEKVKMKGGLTFSSPVATAEFSKFAGILSAALSQHHLSGFEIAQLEFYHLH